MMELKTRDLLLSLSPDVGGSIARCAVRTPAGPFDLLRPAACGAGDAADSGCFPLVPFSNRVRDGRFMFRGREVQLPQIAPGQRHPLHGQGWRAVWRTAHRTRETAVLVFAHEPDDWPWAYEARQTFLVGEGTLQIVLACRNASQDDMPCGLGLHPYFPCTERTILDAETTGVRTVDSEIMPVARTAPAGRYDLRHTHICGQNLDNSYDGWSGRATVEWPDRGIGLALTCDTQFLQLYAPPEGGVFAAEPVSHANAALNAPESEWPSLGLRVLAPGEEMTLTVRFELDVSS